MKKEPSFYRWQEEDLILFCHLQPGARQDDYVGLHDNRLKIRIKAPPVEGKANKYLVQFLADSFGVPARQVMVENGELARQKTIRIIKPALIPECLNISR